MADELYKILSEVDTASDKEWESITLLIDLSSFELLEMD